MGKPNVTYASQEELLKALNKWDRQNTELHSGILIGNTLSSIANIIGRPKTSGELLRLIGGRYDLGGIMGAAGSAILGIAGAVGKVNGVKLLGKQLLGLIKATNFNTSNFDDLLALLNNYTPMSKISASDLTSGTASDILGAVGAGISGFASGELATQRKRPNSSLILRSAYGGPINNKYLIGGLIGAGVGMASSVVGSILANKEAKRLARKINDRIQWANDYSQRSIDNNADNLISDLRLVALDEWNQRALGGPIDYPSIGSAIDYAFMNDWLNNLYIKALNTNKLNIQFETPKFALGGQLFKLGGLHTNGSSWSDGMTTVNTGLSHELNPYEGVPMGIDNEGTPNLVELDETIYNDYVYSDRLTVPKLPKNIKKGTMHKLNTSLKEVSENSNRMLKKFEGMTYAKASKLAEKISGVKERPNDPIAKRGFEAMLAVLAESLEMERLKELVKEIQLAIALMSPEELQLLLMAMQQEALLQLLPLMSPEELAMYEQLIALLLMSPELQAAMLLLAMLELLMLLIPQLLLVDNQGLPIVAAYGGRLFGEGGPTNPDLVTIYNNFNAIPDDNPIKKFILDYLAKNNIRDLNNINWGDLEKQYKSSDIGYFDPGLITNENGNYISVESPTMLNDIIKFAKVEPNDLGNLGEDSTATTTGASVVVTGDKPIVTNTDVKSEPVVTSALLNLTTPTYGLSTNMLSTYLPELLEVLASALGINNPILASKTAGERTKAIDDYKLAIVNATKNMDLATVLSRITDFNPAENYKLEGDNEGETYEYKGSDGAPLAGTLHYTIEGLGDNLYFVPASDFRKYYNIGLVTPIDGEEGEFTAKLTRKALPLFYAEPIKKGSSGDKNTFDTSDYPLPNTNSYKAALITNLSNSIHNAITPEDLTVSNLLLARSNMGFTPVAATPVTGRMTYVPTDRRVDISDLNSLFNRSGNLILNTASNAGLAMSGLLANDYSRINALSKLNSQLDELDRLRYNEATKFNSSIALANSELGLKAAMANLESLYRTTASNNDMLVRGTAAWLTAHDAKEKAINLGTLNTLNLVNAFDLLLYANDLTKWWLSHVGLEGLKSSAKGGKINRNKKK